ncbi:MAG: GNAT family N-acetyltransferase [Alphaproteobacteria bacterium]|jgi:ribosomal-protein-alanine N-acetyltransferase|nr:GNAT family N-acetyltransferase [Alphaproteobacteria bacterium]
MTLPAAGQTRIETGRLVIRAPQRGDYEAWRSVRARSRGHLEPWEPRWPADALSREDWARRLKAWRSGWRNDRAYVFLIFPREEAVLLGGASVTNVRRGSAASGVIGYWLGEAALGQGYMREAVSAVCEWCFSVLGLERLEAATLPENQRSRRVLEAAGFTEEGFARGYLEIAGRRRDHVVYGRLAGDVVR